MQGRLKRAYSALFVHLESTTHTGCLLLLLLLHLLGDFNVHFKVFADASIETDGLALVQVSFTVIGGNALLDAAVGETIGTLVFVQELDQVGNGGRQLQSIRMNIINSRIYIPSHHVCDHLNLQLGLPYLLFGGDLGPAAEQVRHFRRELTVAVMSRRDIVWIKV